MKPEPYSTIFWNYSMMFNPKPNETQSESHSQTSTFNNFIHNIHSIATNGLSEK